MDKGPLSIEQICEIIPHRPPMLLLDRVLELSETDVVAEKLVSPKEVWLDGHFPDRPIMPGFMILEAIAQAAAVWVVKTRPEVKGRGTALLGVNHARFRRPVQPGDLLHLNARILRTRGLIFRFEGTATVNGELAAETEFIAAIVDWEGAQ